VLAREADPLSFSTTRGIPVTQISVNGQLAAAVVDNGATACFAAPSLIGDAAEEVELLHMWVVSTWSTSHASYNPGDVRSLRA